MSRAVLLALLVAGLAAAVRTGVRLHRRSRVSRRLSDRRALSDGPAGQCRQVFPAPASLVRSLDRAALEIDPDLAWHGWLVALVAVPAAAFVLGGAGALGLAAMGLVAAPAVVLRSRRGRADAQIEAALPDALEAMARALRSGASLPQAVEEAGESAPGALGGQLAQVRRVAATSRCGLTGALEAFAERCPLPGVRLAVAALCLGVETGGAHARAVDGVAATLRDRLNLAAEIKALSSQAKASALVIGLAPLGFGGLAAVTDPRTADFLLRTPLGLAFVTAGLALDAAGWLWMQRLSRVEA